LENFLHFNFSVNISVVSLRSLDYKCPVCGGVKDLLHPVTDASKADSEEAKELASQINFQAGILLAPSVCFSYLIGNSVLSIPVPLNSI